MGGFCGANFATQVYQVRRDPDRRRFPQPATARALGRRGRDSRESARREAAGVFGRLYATTRNTQGGD